MYKYTVHISKNVKKLIIVLTFLEYLKISYILQIPELNQLRKLCSRDYLGNEEYPNSLQQKPLSATVGHKTSTFICRYNGGNDCSSSCLSQKFFR